MLDSLNEMKQPLGERFQAFLRDGVLYLNLNHRFLHLFGAEGFLEEDFSGRYVALRRVPPEQRNVV